MHLVLTRSYWFMVCYSQYYSQYLQLRRNFSSDEDFRREASVLKARLLERGYSKKISRDRLLFFHKPKSNPPLVKLIIRFTQQHDQIYSIIQKHWWLLRLDPKLCPPLKPRPEVTYTFLRDQLVRSHYSDSTTRCCEIPGTFYCSQCNTCRYMASYAIVPSLGSGRFSCRHYVDCTTAGVIYLRLCECRSHYVGKTWAFQVRIRKHLWSYVSTWSA